MSTDNLARTVDDAWERRSDISPKTKGPVRKAVQSALELLDAGKARVAERQPPREQRLAGCDQLQGYLISRPIPAPEIKELFVGASEMHVVA